MFYWKILRHLKSPQNLSENILQMLLNFSVQFPNRFRTIIIGNCLWRISIRVQYFTHNKFTSGIRSGKLSIVFPQIVFYQNFPKGKYILWHFQSFICVSYLPKYLQISWFFTGALCPQQVYLRSLLFLLLLLSLFPFLLTLNFF